MEEGADMTNAEKLNEIVKKEFGIDGNSFIYFLDSHSCYGFKCESPWCNKCSHRDFWKKEVTEDDWLRKEAEEE